MNRRSVVTSGIVVAAVAAMAALATQPPVSAATRPSHETTPRVVSAILVGTDLISPSDGWAVGYTFPKHRGSEVADTLIERWDGSDWTRVPSPNAPRASGSRLSAVEALSATDAWAVGDYSTRTGRVRTLAEHWDGTAWSVVSSPHPGSFGSYLSGVSATSSTDAWAVGGYESPTHSPRTLVAHWNGTTWSKLRTVKNDSGHLAGVDAVAPDDVWAVGQDDGALRAVTEHWDGTSWTRATRPAGSHTNYSSVSSTASDDVWAVGTSQRGSEVKTLTAHWDGSTWNDVFCPSTGLSRLTGVSAVASNDVWAVGWNVPSRAGHPRPLVDHWDGARWLRVQTPHLPGSYRVLSSVSGASATSAVAVGFVQFEQRQHQQGLTEHWDGTSWTVAP